MTPPVRTSRHYSPTAKEQDKDQIYQNSSLHRIAYCPYSCLSLLIFQKNVIGVRFCNMFGIYIARNLGKNYTARDTL
jgi:hypothetical protein